MNKLLIFIILIIAICITNITAQQLSIGSGVSDQSAIAELHSDSAGFIMPRMTTEAMLNINLPAQGLNIYNTDDDLIYTYVSDRWKRGGEQTEGEDYFLNNPLTWYKMAPTPIARYGAVSFTMDSDIYIVTGYTNDPNNSNRMYKYSPEQNEWTEMAPFPGSPRVDATGFVIGRKAYIGTGLGYVGGRKSDFYSYDVDNNTWSPKEDYPLEVTGCSSFADNGKGYVVGGLKLGEYVSSVYRYDTLMNNWTQLNDYPLTISDAYSFILKGNIYVGGGKENGLQEFRLYRYDPVKDLWSEPYNLLSRGTDGDAAVLYDNAFIGTFEGFSVEGDFYRFTNFDMMPAVYSFVDERISASMETVKNELYVIGGTFEDQGGTYLDDVYKLSVREFKQVVDRDGNRNWSSNINHKTVEGITPSSGSSEVNIPTGLSAEQVISLDICIDYLENGSCIPPNYTYGSNGHEYEYWLQPNGKVKILLTASNSSQLFDKAITINISYKK